MAMTDAKTVWDRFDADVRNLGGELRRHFRGAEDQERSAELNRALDQLRSAADAVFTSLDRATRDPEVRTKTRQAARSFGAALAETFRELGDQVDRAVRKPPQTPPAK